MSGWQQHLPIIPVLLPLVFAATLLVIDEQRRIWKRGVSLLGLLLLLASAIALLRAADADIPLVYRLGGWPAPFGIVLVGDRLAALMVLLASLLGLAAYLFSCARWDRAGPRFHCLLHALLMGVNGAFLTGDLFNLFVFFEVLLAASYGLALHGSGRARVQASLHYIIVNLVASLLFLVGVSLIYGMTGTLNMAELSVQVPLVAAADQPLLLAAAALLGMAFLIKAGIWPLCFWLPRSYATACAPAAALFAILTKVGIYAVLRLWLLFFGGAAGGDGGFGRDWLVVLGLATLAFGALGVFGTRDLSKFAAFSLISSCGTLLAAIGAAQVEASAAALYYLLASTLGVSALFLLVEVIERSRAPDADIRAITEETYGSFESEGFEEVGVAIPATWALLGISFIVCMLLLAGLPPMPGFLGKLALLDALLGLPVVTSSTWVLLTLLMLSGLATVIAASRIGVRIFWAAEQTLSVRISRGEVMAILLLLGMAFALVLQAGRIMQYLGAAAQSLHAPVPYLEGVLL